MDIERKFEHKDYGEIGAVALTVPTDGWSIDGQPLSEESVKYLATFALQSLQDAYAGAKDSASAIGAFGKKYDRLVNGEIGTREGGKLGGVKARAVQIAMRHAPKGDAKEKRAWALKAVDRNPAFMSLAQAQLDEEKALNVTFEVPIE